MTDKEFYKRLRTFLNDNMGAFAKWNTDIMELNELGMELNERLRNLETEVESRIEVNGIDVIDKTKE